MPWSGNLAPDHGAHGGFGGAIGRGYRIEGAAGLLSSTPSAVRKNGRMVSPDTVAKLIDEAREIDCRHVAPFPAIDFEAACGDSRVRSGSWSRRTRSIVGGIAGRGLGPTYLACHRLCESEVCYASGFGHLVFCAARWHILAVR